MPKACSVCDREGETEPTILLGPVGMVCHPCFELLSVPAEENGESVLTKCRRALRSFEETRQELRAMARERCWQ